MTLQRATLASPLGVAFLPTVGYARFYPLGDELYFGWCDELGGCVVGSPSLVTPEDLPRLQSTEWKPVGGAR